MPGRSRLESILDHAEEEERQYAWLSAVESYKKGLRLASETDFSRRGEICERIGYAYFRAAMQAETADDFNARCAEATEYYRRTKAFVGKTEKPDGKAWVFRCDAMIAYIGYWLASEVSEKKRLLDECWSLVKESLREFEAVGNAWEYGRTYNRLSVSALFIFFYDWNFQTRETTVRGAADYGEKAIKYLLRFADSRELARAYVRTATYHEMLGFYFLDLSERESDYQKALDYWLRACELYEKAAYIELLNSAALLALESLNWEWGTDTTLANFSKALRCGKRTKDRLIVGWGLDWLELHTLFKAEVCESAEKKVELCNKALRNAKKAKQQYSLISYVSPLWGALWAEAPYAYYYWELAAYEVNSRKKRELLEKAAEASTDLLKKSEDSGYPEILMFAHHASGDIFLSLARIEKNEHEKKELLEKALTHQNEAFRIISQFVPFYYWKRGKMLTFVADVKCEISELVKDPDVKKSLLLEAVLDKENSLRLVTKYAKFWEDKGSNPALFANLGNWQYGYGDMLNRLYEFTGDSEHLRKATAALEEAVRTFTKLDLVSRVAECYWKMAQTCDLLGEHLGAANDFHLASDAYLKVAEKIPQLADFYREHASYMEAWSEIEKARHHHRRREYGVSMEHFEKAAEMLGSLKRWDYHASIYKAWALLERAEKSSQQEQNEEALTIFEQAANLFEKTKAALETSLDSIEDDQEKSIMNNVITITDLRSDYCRARSALEEARIFDKKGDHTDSTRKYEDAQKILQRTAEKETEQNRRELETLIYLCQAWRKMAMAETKASPKLYNEAAELFEQAKEHMADEQTSLLVLANSSFCKALAAGTEFENTRSSKSYSTSKKHMEAAANYYLRAGFTNASEHVRATQRLFDAHMYLGKAQTETEPEKKAQYYRLAERLLQASAELYSKAKHPQKSQEVERLLKSARQEKQLAVSLTTALSFPAISSTASVISPLTPSYESPVGLERFEQTDIQAHLTASEEATVGEEFEVRLDLVNVARNFGLLVRVDNVAPQGFRVTNVPSQFVLENGSIDMKGKRLDALNVETIKILLEPAEAGVAYLCPEVVYTDDRGSFKTSRTEAVKVTVHAPLAFKFKTDAAHMVFDYLVSAFIDDYMKRRLSMDESGWRSLAQIAKSARVSFRSVYGDRRRRGSAIFELENRGFIENRIFAGRRGRGGRITNARITYEKEIMRRYVDARVAEKR